MVNIYIAVFKRKRYNMIFYYNISGNEAKFIPKDTALGISLAAAVT